MTGENPRSGPKIVVIGGGSQFSVGLCESLADYARDTLAGARVVLLDTNPGHIETVGRYGQELARRAGVDLR